MSSLERGRATDVSEDTFERVVETVDGWTSDTFGYGSVTRGAQRALDRALNAGTASPWERDIVERGYACGDLDLVVNGTIGVVVVRQFTQGEATNFNWSIRSHARAYDYLVVYLHGIPRRHSDRWRHVAHKQTARRLGVEAIEFVHAPQRDPSTEAAADSHPAAALAGPAAQMLLLGTVVATTRDPAVVVAVLLLLVVVSLAPLGRNGE